MDIFAPVEAGALWLVSLTGLAGAPADALSYFLYDIVKIFLLLAVIIFAVSIIRTFVPPKRIASLLAGKGGLGYLMAAMVGIITPFCTCSAIPLFIGLLEAGVPLGITFTFLVASPMINEVALALLWGSFGFDIALIYVFSGMAIAIVAGFIIGRLGFERYLEQDVIADGAKLGGSQFKRWRQRISFGCERSWNIIKKVAIYIIIGVAIGSWIHGYVPNDFLASYAKGWYAVPLATIIGVPLYSNAAGVVPLVSALVEKGMGMGTALAFMMAVVGLSLPEFLILRRVMKPKLIVTFAIVVALGIMLTGFLFNALLG